VAVDVGFFGRAKLPLSRVAGGQIDFFTSSED
jgi:hypothetical protein